ncbi:unnamed protein product, partial [Symbiodinium pilosum]
PTETAQAHLESYRHVLEEFTKDVTTAEGVASSHERRLAAQKRKQEKKDKEEAEKIAKAGGGKVAEGTEAPWPEDGQEQQDQWHDDETEPADAAETWNDDS